MPSRRTVRVYRFDMALPRVPRGPRHGVEAAEERESHTAEDIGGRGRSLAEELPTAPDSSHVGAWLRADVPVLIRYGVDVDSCDVHDDKMPPLSSFVKGIHTRRRKKIFGPSCPFLYARARSSVVVFATPRTV